MLRQVHHIFAKVPLIFRVVPLYVVAGLVLTAPQLVDRMTDSDLGLVQAQVVAKQMPAAPTEPVATTGKPVRMVIPSLGLERQVVAGQYDSSSGDWTLSDDKVQFATMTGLLSDQPSQPLLYGHNTVAVLEPVRLIKPGDELVVTTDNGHEFHYSYVDDREVEPTDVAVLYEKPDKSRLVLMTCEGIFSETRRLLYFDLKAVV